MLWFSALFDVRVFVSSPNCCADFRFSCVDLAWSISVTEPRGGRADLFCSFLLALLPTLLLLWNLNLVSSTTFIGAIHYGIDNIAYNRKACGKSRPSSGRERKRAAVFAG